MKPVAVVTGSMCHISIERGVAVLATGYRSRIDTILTGISGVYDDGQPSSSGYMSNYPGLYFWGYYVAPNDMLREIGIEARRISAVIAVR